MREGEVMLTPLPQTDGKVKPRPAQLSGKWGRLLLRKETRNDDYHRPFREFFKSPNISPSNQGDGILYHLRRNAQTPPLRPPPGDRDAQVPRAGGREAVFAVRYLA